MRKINFLLIVLAALAIATWLVPNTWAQVAEASKKYPGGKGVCESAGVLSSCSPAVMGNTHPMVFQSKEEQDKFYSQKPNLKEPQEKMDAGVINSVSNPRVEGDTHPMVFQSKEEQDQFFGKGHAPKEPAEGENIEQSHFGVLSTSPRVTGGM